NTILYWRVQADDWIAQGLNWSAVQTFTRLPNPPTVGTELASSITQSSVTLNATVNSEGGSVSSCRFEYGTAAAYSLSAPCASLPGSGETPVAVSASVTGLASNTTYHFRVVATNSGGTSYGGDRA